MATFIQTGNAVVSDNGSLGRQAVPSLVRGLCFGFGFSLAAVAVSMATFPLMSSRIDSAASMDSIEADADARIKQLTVSDLEERKQNSEDAIIGSVRNDGSRPARNVKVEADLFNQGKFVDQYSTSISGSIPPGESRHFKISCGCKDSQAAEHDSFKVQVVREY